MKLLDEILTNRALIKQKKELSERLKIKYKKCKRNVREKEYYKVYKVRKFEISCEIMSSMSSEWKKLGTMLSNY